jgi:small-conductance mechanosensitive channel
MNVNLLSYSLSGNTVGRYLLCISVFVCSIIILRLFRVIIFSKIKRMTEKTDSMIDDLLTASFRKNIIPLMYLASAYFSAGLLIVNSSLERWSWRLFLIALGFFTTRFIISIIIFFSNRFWQVKDGNNNEKNISVLLNTIIKIIVWSVSILILLDNLGVRVSGLVAGLGVGGVAIAFAAQSILGDIFNYFTIFFDRPFEIGDFLVIDQFSGVVEHIGVKTTRIRSLSGEELIFSNTDLTGSRVRNYKNMQERRVVFSFGVTYQTPVAKLKQITKKVESIINGIGTVRFDRAHFHKFGDSSLDFEVVFYVLSGDYKTYMDAQQEINLKIMTELARMKVEFAYPTRTLFMERA